MFKYLLLIPVAFFYLSLNAQSPVNWTFDVKPVDKNGTFDIICKGVIQPGWYVYSQYLENDNGPVATSINFYDTTSVKRTDKGIEEGKMVSGYDDMFVMNIVKFKEEFTITQRVYVIGSGPIKGYLNFMSCDASKCLPPKDVEFSLDLNPEHLNKVRLRRVKQD